METTEIPGQLSFAKTCCYCGTVMPFEWWVCKICEQVVCDGCLGKHHTEHKFRHDIYRKETS